MTGASGAAADGHVAPVGRAGEIDTLRAALDRAERGATVLVEGEAGIGKSTLVAQVERMAAPLGLRLLHGEARELDGRRPFGVLIEALGIRSGATDPVQREIIRLLRLGPAVADLHLGPGRRPGPQGGPQPGTEPDPVAGWVALESRIGELLLEALDERSADRPYLLVLEDLHWADAASLHVLHRLTGDGSPPGLVLVGTARRMPRRPELTSLLALWSRHDGVRLQLGPLAPEVCAELAHRVLGRPAGPRLLDRLGGAAGNPFFLTEMLLALEVDGALSLDGQGRFEAATSQVPSSLAQTIRARLSYLSAATAETLGMASVLGSSFRLADLAALSGRPVGWCWERVQPAVGGRVLHVQGDRLVFRHGLFRDALYVALPEPLRAGLHGDCARVLHAAGAPAAEVAEHVLRSGASGDARALDWLRAAAQEAAHHSPAVAAELLQGCLRLTAAADPGRPALSLQLAEALGAAGRTADSEKVCRDLLTGPLSGELEAGARACLARVLLDQNQAAAALEQVSHVQRLARLPPVETVRFDAWSALLRLLVGDLEGAGPAAEAADRAAADLGDAPATVVARLTLAHLARSRADLAQARSLAASACALADDDGSVQAHETTPHVVHALALMDSDRLAEAAEEIVKARRFAELAGATGRHVLAAFAEAGQLYLAGQWQDAASTLESVWPLAEETGLEWQVDALYLRALLCGQLGDRRSAVDWAERGDAAVAGGSPVYRPGQVAWIRAVLAEAAGDPGAALDLLRGGWDLCATAGMPCDYRWLGPDLARLAARAGDPTRATEVARALEAQASANPDVTGIAAAAERARAWATDDPDRHLAAMRLLDADAARPYERARAAEDAAVALSTAGRAREAVACAGVALDVLAGMQAEGELSRVRSALRGVGLRLGVRGGRSRPTSGWAALTPTEQRVARLVATRMTNPEVAQVMYLSRRTVATHVSHLLAKLGMGSRLELVAAAARAPLEDLGSG